MVEFLCELDSFLLTIQFFVNVGFALTPTSLFDFLHKMDRRQPSSSLQVFLRSARPFCSLGPKITIVMHLKRLAVSVFFFFQLSSVASDDSSSPASDERRVLKSRCLSTPPARGAISPLIDVRGRRPAEAVFASLITFN